MNRRHFLKAFTGGVVGAGVMIAAPKVAPFDAMRAQANDWIRFDFPNPGIHPTMEGIQKFREIIWAGTTDVHLNEEGRAIMRRYYYEHFPPYLSSDTTFPPK